jgi:ligand-binding sensor domain-containing protein
MLWTLVFTNIMHAQWIQTNGPYGGIVGSLGIITNNTLFAGIDGGGNYRSTNNGDSWIAMNNGLADNYIRASAINSNGYIFAGTSNGVFYSTNNGDNWTAVNNGLSNTDIYAIAINSNGRIFAGTGGGLR